VDVGRLIKNPSASTGTHKGGKEGGGEAKTTAKRNPDPLNSNAESLGIS
jgi:hypothetical protein